MTRLGAVLLSVFLVAVLCPASPGQIPQKANYQVMLTDDADQPLADQSVTMVFRLYDVSSGGSALWTETQVVTTNSVGVASVILGAVNPIDVPFDAPRWLEVEVNGEILSPRREIVSTPYAGRAASSEDSDRLGDIEASEYALLSDISAMGDGHSLDADDGDPEDAVYVDSDGQTQFRDVVEIGIQNGDGSVRLYEGGNAHVGAQVFVDGGGGSVRLHDESGNLTALLTYDPTGTGGLLHIARNGAGSAGFTVDGNYSGEATRVTIEGPSREAVFDMSMEGDDSVQLPDGSLNSSEIIGMPGVASIQAEPWIILPTTSVTSVAARTMTSVPADGYIFVMATAQLQMVNMPQQAHRALFGVSASQTAFSGAAQEAEIQIADGLPSGYYDHHVAVSGLFEVSAGSSPTYYLLAYEGDGDCAVRARQLTLMYFPIAHGPVDTTD